MEDTNKKTSKTMCPQVLWDALQALPPQGITQTEIDEAAQGISDRIDTDVLNELLAEANHTTVIALDCAGVNDEDVLTLTGSGIDLWSLVPSTPGDDISFYDDAITIPVPQLTLTRTQPVTAITICNPVTNDLVVEIKLTGEVTLGKNVSAEHAAHEFWTRLAEYGGQFEERITTLEDELALVEQDLDDEQSMRLELEATLNSVCIALDVPSGEEDNIVDYVRKITEGRADVSKVLRALRGIKERDQLAAEDPVVAYERAMKIVR